mgnify:CR=1 FL=1
MMFWVAAAAAVLIVLAALGRALLAPQSDDGPAAAQDVAFYRAALDEVARDRARGTLSDTEAERARLDLSRRLLAADARLSAETGGARPAPRAATLTGAAVTAGALALSVALYVALGAPGTPDRPRAERLAAADEARASRPTQAEAESRASGSPATGGQRLSDLIAQLRARLEEDPGDARGWRLLARAEAGRGDFAAAHRAQARLIEVLGADAGAPAHATLADLRVRAAGGVVTEAAQRAIESALMRDPANGLARYYRGLMEAQTGRPDRAFAIWRPLLEESPPDAPWTAPVREFIGRVAQRAGVDYQPPAPAPSASPDAADLDAAGEMAPDQRREAIRGMVAGLAGRLEAEGGTPAEWARLIRSYGVLGETEKARETLADARAALAGDAAALETVTEAARGAGLTAGGQ